MDEKLMYAMGGTISGVLLSFVLTLCKGILVDYHQMKSLSWAIDTELAEIELQFLDILMKQIFEAKGKRAFVEFNYTEKYTNVFDSNIGKCDIFNYKDLSKLVSVYMIIRSYFDTLRTVSNAFETHLNMIKENKQACEEITTLALQHYSLIEGEHKTMVEAIKQAHCILGTYRSMGFFKFVIFKMFKQ